MIRTFDKGRLYWIFQFSGWGLFFLVFTVMGVVFYGLQLKIVGIYLYGAILGFVLSHIYRNFILKRKNWIRFSLKNLIIRVLLASFIMGLIYTSIYLPVQILLFELKKMLGEVIVYPWGMAIIFVFNFTILFFGWQTLYFGINFFFNYKKSEIEKWRLKASVKESELQSLKSQINPHFIFNSLNNIRSLISENPEKAREMVTNLSSLLRFAVQLNKKQKIDLQDELHVVRSYLNLESIQFENRLNYSFDIDDKVLDYQVPPMSIQTLVENAIKHGIGQIPEGGKIKISAQEVNNKLVIKVKNSGRLLNKNNGTGIGLKNTSDRLKLIYGSKSDLTISSNENNMVEAQITIPI